MATTNLIRFNNLRGNIFGGVIDAVVSLPLALSFGIASGIGPPADSMGRFVAAFLPPCLAVPNVDL